MYTKRCNILNNDANCMDVTRSTSIKDVLISYPARSKAPVVSLSKKLYPYCLVLIGSRNGFEPDFTIELKQIEGLVEDRLTR